MKRIGILKDELGFKRRRTNETALTAALSTNQPDPLNAHLQPSENIPDSNPGPSTAHQPPTQSPGSPSFGNGPGWRKTGWNGFKEALEVLNTVSGALDSVSRVFPPLHAAVGGLLEVLKVIDVRHSSYVSRLSCLTISST